MTDANKLDNTGDNEEEFNFESSYSDNFPGILKGLNISLVVTSYQSSKLFFIRSDGQSINVNFKTFYRPMGLAVTEEQITLGASMGVMRFCRNDGAIEQLDDSDKVDACFSLNVNHTTGMINIHDIAYGSEGLWITNSAFSCLATIEPDYSFIPRWKPPFVSDLQPEDRCHLNGMAMLDGEPRYVTMFNQSDSADAWREKGQNGTLMDVKTNEILVEGQAMPHSPRCYQGKIYFCESGYGLVKVYDPQTKQVDTIFQMQGFVRGMDFFGPLMFVGSSKLRESTVNSQIPLAEIYDETYCGICIINLETNEVVGHLRFDGDVEQIYDVAVLPNICYPELIEPDNELLPNLFKFPPL